MTIDKSIAVCPGSYDPITNGHLDVICRAAELYDEVIVAVVNRSVRKSGTLFTTEERVGFIERATAQMPGVRVEPFSNLVVEFARSPLTIAFAPTLLAKSTTSVLNGSTRTSLRSAIA